MKIGLITNPRSERNKRRGSPMAAAARGEPDIVRGELDSIADIGPILAEFAAREVGLLALDGGDGTIQAVLSTMFNDAPFERNPLLAAIPSGMTNAVAADVGLGDPPRKAFARLQDAARRGPVAASIAERAVIRMSRGPDRPAVYGMLFGLGAVCRAIELCRRGIHPLGITSSLAVGATIAGLLARRALNGAREDEIFRGESVEVGWDGAERRSGERLLMLGSTLRRFALGMTPFWGEGPGALRVTDVAYPADRLARSVLPILCAGRPPRINSEGYVSRNVERVSLRMSCPFTLDGEMFEPLPDTPVTLEIGGAVRFLH